LSRSRKRPPVTISVDIRGAVAHGPARDRALALHGQLVAAGETVDLVNINESLVTLGDRTRGRVVFVCAETPDPASPLGRKFRHSFPFRRWLESCSAMVAGSLLSGIQRSSSFDKSVCRKVLRYNEIPVPPGLCRKTNTAIDTARIVQALGLPLIVKQARESGVGVGVHLADSLEKLDEFTRWHVESRRKDVVYEQFVKGREFTVWIVERRGVPAPAGMIEFSKPAWNPLMDQGAKRRCRQVRRFTRDTRYWPEAIVDPDLPPVERRLIEGAALASHRACGLRHYSRVDLILTESGPVVLDVNANPELGGWLALCAEARGSTLGGVFRSLVMEAARENGR